MYGLKKIEKVFMSKFVRTGPSSYKKKRIYRAAVSQRLRNTGLVYQTPRKSKHFHRIHPVVFCDNIVNLFRQ